MHQPNHDPDFPPEESVPTSRETARTLMLVQAMPDHLSHEQYVSLLAIAFRHGVLHDREYQCFMDVRDPNRFMPTGVEVKKIVIERLAKIVEKETMEKAAGVPAVGGHVHVSEAARSIVSEVAREQVRDVMEKQD